MESKALLLVLAFTLASGCWGLHLRPARSPQEDELEGLRKNIPGEPGKDYPIFSIDILRKINPGQYGGRPSGAGSGGAAKSASPTPTNQPRQAKQGAGGDKVDFQSQVSKGQIPGTPGKDYPVNSVDALKKKNPGSFGNLQPAPAHLITPDYPGIGSLPKGKLPPGSAPPQIGNAPPLPLGTNSAAGGPPAGDYCPGGSQKECVNFCPPEERFLEACTAACNKRCSK